MKVRISLICLMLLCWSVGAAADISRAQAIAVAQKSVAGRVLTATRQTERGTVVWRIKLLTAHGVVRIVRIDARSGQAL